MSGPLNSGGHLALMLCTVSADSSGKNLSLFRKEFSQLSDIFVIYMFNFIYAKLANFPSGPSSEGPSALLVIHITVISVVSVPFSWI